MEKLSTTPENTLNRYESDYTVCENRCTGKMFDIPILMVDPYARNSDILKLENDNYRIDYNENEKQRKISRNSVTKFRDI